MEFIEQLICVVGILVMLLMLTAVAFDRYIGRGGVINRLMSEDFENGLKGIYRMEDYVNRTMMKIEAEKIDASVAKESSCSKCGHFGLRFEARYEGKEGEIYRAFTVCPECGNREEF